MSLRDDNEYRVTYCPHGAKRLEHEHLGLCGEKAAREVAERRGRGLCTDVRLWRRPKPARWELLDL